MRKIILPFLFTLLVWSCSAVKNTGSTQADKTFEIDSTEYEITIIDPEFDSWYLMHFSPAKDYSNEFYRSKNSIAVSNWNEYFNRGRFHRVVENYIPYDNTADYGIEVNRKLYWYFKYVEDKYNLRLLY